MALRAALAMAVASQSLNSRGVLMFEYKETADPAGNAEPCPVPAPAPTVYVYTTPATLGTGCAYGPASRLTCGVDVQTSELNSLVSSIQKSCRILLHNNIMQSAYYTTPPGTGG